MCPVGQAPALGREGASCGGNTSGRLSATLSAGVGIFVNGCRRELVNPIAIQNLQSRVQPKVCMWKTDNFGKEYCAYIPMNSR